MDKPSEMGFANVITKPVSPSIYYDYYSAGNRVNLNEIYNYE